MHRHFDIDRLAFRTHVDLGFARSIENRRVDQLFGLVDVIDKAANATGKCEVFLFRLALIDQLDPHAIVQKRQLAKSLRKNLVVKTDVGEDVDIGQEMNFGAPFVGASADQHR